MKGPRYLLLTATVGLAIVAVILAVSGGFRATVGGFRISARSPFVSTIAALIAGGAWLVLARRHHAIAADLESAWSLLQRHASRAIGVTALIAAIVASTFATRSAAGADASGYLSQAAMWGEGRAAHVEPLAAEVRRLDGWMTSPLGWRPFDQPGSIDSRSALQAPTYPPGLPLLMAVPHRLLGLDGAAAVIVAASAVAVWATGMAAGGTAGVVAAILIAFTPVFLYQSFQPMSDVPVTAAWLLGWLLVRGGSTVRRSILAGVVCAVAVLIRPNLAPLVLVPLVMSDRKVPFAIPVMVAGGCLAIMHNFWYGSPVRSGYGSAEELFALQNAGPNMMRYSQWLVATAPLLLLAGVGIFRLRHDGQARALAIFAGLVIAGYLVYAVFDDWSYLRFLLPALAVFAVFAGIALAAWIERRPVAARFPIFIGVMLVIVAHGLFVARSLEAFRLKDHLRRVAQAADFINRTAPDTAVLIAGEQSGAMRYYTGRSILRWDAATAEGLREAIEALLNAGRPIYIVLDAWEDERFRARYPDLGPGALDWPPALEAGSSHRTRIWNLADRMRFQIGQRINTVRLP